MRTKLTLLSFIVMGILTLHLADSACAAERREMKDSNGTVVTYPAPKGAALSDRYTVKVNGKPVDVYLAPVWEPGYVKSFGGPYSFAYFDCSGSVSVEVDSRKPLQRVRILPESRGIRPDVKSGTLTFVLKSPCQLSIEPAAKEGPLLLFANPLEMDPPKEGDPGVIYFGPGMHKPGEIKVGDNQTLYIAGGAVVKGGIRAQGVNIRIRGRGIVDGLDWERFKGPTGNLICLTKCANASVEGVILKDSWSWTFPMFGCRGVHIDNVKICSARCENNDGIGTCNSQDVEIENCFIRTDDDSITAKGMGEDLGQPPYPPVENLTVKRCVLWTDRANVFRLGCECRAQVMRKLVFRDIDVLHYTDPTCPVIILQPAEGMLMEDVRFENIRINGEGQRKFIEISPAPTQWAKQQVPGAVRNVLFKDLVLDGVGGDNLGLIEVAGFDASHTVEGVTFENVMRFGRRVAQDSPSVRIGANTKDIVFK
jgi:hypothetical protein